ncbi:hypothetical protein J4Q44_G00096120 [Coregonus suidteri]|uniref:Uncharacterized protein n=1 Tax=Coregonus suidteri TaxID=861788 RepID=A0AAN8LXE8_9TELE
MAGAMSVTKCISFVLVAVALGSTATKATTKNTPTLSVTTTVVPASPASRTSTSPLTPSEAYNGSTTIQTSRGFTADSTMNQTLTGTTGHDSTSSIFSSTLSPNSDFTTGNMSSSTALQSDGRHVLSRSPGLVAVLCIFCICLGLMLAVGIAKLITSRGSTFQRLEDVPLGKINEESPFARYPTKQF